MHPVLYYPVLIWVVWLIFDGLCSGSVWTKGGASDRFTRDIDMHSFAHKVKREDKPTTYWFVLGFYTVIALLMLYLIILN